MSQAQGNATHLKLGLGQLLVEGGEPDRNIERAAEMARQAAKAGCDILLLPETLDLAWTHPSAFDEAQPIPGPYSDRFCTLARELGLFICCGLTEQAGDRVYNAAILVDDCGEILLKHRKINLLTVEFDYYAFGGQLGVTETKFGTIGLNVCADNYGDSTDIGHTLGRMGAQLILSPSSWTVDHSVTERDDPYGTKWLTPFQTLARTHDLVIASATSVGYVVGGPYEGKKSVGCSMVVNKDGIIAKGRYNEFAGDLVVVDVDVPPPHPMGTLIGERMTSLGFQFAPEGVR
ncbi:MAG: carbon-nitrogen hydrolase family protein [Rhodospirillales bacterium]